MPQTIWHCFSSQLLIPFQMVCSVLLTMLHQKTLLLIGCEFSTANKKPTNKWFFMATQREKRSTPSEWALKTELKTGVRLFVAFCLTQFVAWQVVAGTSQCLQQGQSKHIMFFFYLHYARTFKARGYMLRVKATSVVRITGRVWRKIR